MKNIYKTLGIKNILFVGNDPWLRDTLSLYLQFQGCSFQSAETAEVAGDKLSRGRFDLVLCGHRVSGMEGLTFLRQCANCQPGSVRILIDEYPDPLTEECPEFSGIDDVIRLPFTVESLEASLQSIIHRAGGPSGREKDTVR